MCGVRSKWKLFPLAYYTTTPIRVTGVARSSLLPYAGTFARPAPAPETRRRPARLRLASGVRESARADSAGGTVEEPYQAFGVH